MFYYSKTRKNVFGVYLMFTTINPLEKDLYVASDTNYTFPIVENNTVRDMTRYEKVKAELEYLKTGEYADDVNKVISYNPEYIPPVVPPVLTPEIQDIHNKISNILTSISDLGTIRDNITSLDNRLENIDFSDIFNKIDSLTTLINNTNADVTNLKDSIVASIQIEIAAVSSLINAKSQEIYNLQLEDESIKNMISVINTDLSIKTNAINTVQSSVANLNDLISTSKIDIQLINEKLSEVETTLTNHNTSIGTNETNISLLNNKVLDIPLLKSKIMEFETLIANGGIGGSLKPEDQAKIDILKTDGIGTKFLNDKGEYIYSERANWDETDFSKASYILNKPELFTKEEIVAAFDVFMGVVEANYATKNSLLSLPLHQHLNQDILNQLTVKDGLLNFNGFALLTGINFMNKSLEFEVNNELMLPVIDVNNLIQTEAITYFLDSEVTLSQGLEVEIYDGSIFLDSFTVTDTVQKYKLGASKDLLIKAKGTAVIKFNYTCAERK